MRTKLFFTSLLLVLCLTSVSSQENQKMKFSSRSEIFIDGNFLARVGPNLKIKKNLDVYVFGEFVRTNPLMKGAENFFSVGSHVSYNLSQTGTYMRVMGKRNFTTKENYGYFLAMQSLKKIPLQPTFLLDTDGMTCFGIYGDMYSNNWLTIGGWLNQAVNKGRATMVEIDIVLKF